MKSKCRFSALLFSMLVLTGAACAQVTITVSAVVNEDGNGYTVAHGPYTFAFTITNFATSSYSFFDPGYYSWFEDEVPDDQLFTSLTGTGVLGNPVQPGYSAPYSVLSTANPNNLHLTLSSEDGQSVGVTTLLGTPVYVDASVSFDAGFLTPDAEFVDPIDYLSGYTGVYGASGYLNLQGLEDGGSFPLHLGFTVTGVTITSAAAIPESSTYAAMLGLGALGLVAWRRRSVRAA